MYGFIYGVLIAKTCKQNTCEIIVYPGETDQFGVGFNIIVGYKSIASKKIGDKLKLWLYSYLTERDNFILGFNSYENLGLFKKILSVSGIGPRVALSIVDYFETPENFYAVVKDKDVTRLSKVSGVGKKSALKIIVSLAESLERLPETEIGTPIAPDLYKLLIAYLQKLGYKQADIKKMIDLNADNLKKAAESGASVEELLKLILKFNA